VAQIVPQPGAPGSDRFPRFFPTGGSAFGPTDTYFQRIDINGTVAERTSIVLPVDKTDRAIAASGDPNEAQTRTATADGKHVRLRTEALPGGGAIMVARSLSETDRALRDLSIVLGIVSLIGIAGAALVGWATARRALRPIDDLTDAAEHVAQTQDFSRPVEGADRDDEIGRLAKSFNAMLQALEQSRAQQQQLVSDASHELRTPLTSLRTAIELLQRADAMPPAQRRELIDHAVAELEELSHLVAELVDLATEQRRDDVPMGDVRLDAVTRSVAERASRRTTHAVTVEAEPWVVHGNETLLDRAVHNLVDNAAKWSPPGAAIDITLRDGEVRVRDNGPGVPADERERVFQRFARGRDAQAVPGSGLGLAIVREIAERHGGEAWLDDAPGGGTVAVLRIPGAAAEITELTPVGAPS
jgi:two-component system sensor histidine kinase MprB